MTSAGARPIRVLVVDDSELLRRGIRVVLENPSPNPIRIVAEAGTAREAVALVARKRFDVMLLDSHLPDGSGFDVCRQILRRAVGARVIMLTEFSDDASVYDAVTSGAQGYLKKDVTAAQLVQAVQDVAAGRSILDPESTGRALRLLREGKGERGPTLARLSAQERRVLAHVATGLTNKQAGKQLGLSQNTVKNYLVGVFEKLQVKRRAQAAAIYAAQAGPSRP